MHVLSFDAFASTVLDELNVKNDEPVTRDTTIVHDLGLDSVALVETLALIEELGSLVDDRALETTETVGDLYHLYVVGQIDMTKPAVVIAT